MEVRLARSTITASGMNSAFTCSQSTFFPASKVTMPVKRADDVLVLTAGAGLACRCRSLSSPAGNADAHHRASTVATTSRDRILDAGDPVHAWRTSLRCRRQPRAATAGILHAPKSLLGSKHSGSMVRR